MTKLNIVFMGTAAFGLPALQAMVAIGHRVTCVYTRAPKPAGRGYGVRKTPIHEAAEGLGLPVRTPRTLKDDAEQAAFRNLGADIAVVAAYGLILPKAILEAPRLGCLNIHGSLLPRWRGAAPIERAILAGDDKTGITIMKMDEGLDTGPMLLRESCAIDDLTAGELHDSLAAIGAKLIVPALEGVASRAIVPRPQPVEGATYAQKIAPDEARLDWREPAVALERRVRAFAPRPGAWFSHCGQRIKVYAAEVIETRRTGETGIAPGTVLDERLLVKCGEGALQLHVLQREGKGKMPAADFLRGFPIMGGTRFEVENA